MTISYAARFHTFIKMIKTFYLIIERIREERWRLHYLETLFIFFLAEQRKNNAFSAIQLLQLYYVTYAHKERIIRGLQKLFTQTFAQRVLDEG